MKLISSHDAPNEHCFISSTTQKYLSQRIEFHRSNYKGKKNLVKKVFNTGPTKGFKKSSSECHACIKLRA